MSKQITRTIAGRQITLENGGSYIATRPMASKLSETFTISIRDANWQIVDEIHHLSYDQANDFLRQFNNGSVSFDGRRW